MRRSRLVLLHVVVACVLVGVAPARAEPGGPYIGRAAYARAQEEAQPRRGGFFRYGWRVTKGAMLFGALGAGAGYLLGGPAAAIDWGTKGAGGGAFWRGTFGSGGSGITKRSIRAFAKADLHEAQGHFLRKHYYKMKGIAWTSVESGVMSGVGSGGLGLVFSGPAGVIPAATSGALLGALFGAGMGTARAYIVPFIKRRSLGWSMMRARGALKELEREPTNPALRDEALRRLHEVQQKKDHLPRLGGGQARAYSALTERLGRLAQHPSLAGLAGGLQ